jgi:ketosteroid isomerase-like protein
MPMHPEQAIREALNNFIAAYNDGDWQRARSLLSDDLVDMSAGATTRTGREAIEFFRTHIESVHAKFIPHLSVIVDELYAAGDWAFDRGSLVVELRPRHGGPATYKRQRFLEIWKLESDGQWRVCRIMDNEP